MTKQNIEFTRILRIKNGKISRDQAPKARMLR